MKRKAPEPSDIMSAEEAARWLHVGINTLYAACTRGEVPHARLGRRLVFSRSKLAEWVAVSGLRK